MADFWGSAAADPPSNAHYSEKHLTPSWPQLERAGEAPALRSGIRFVSKKKTRPDALLQLQVGLLLSRTTFSSETSEETFGKLSKESI